METTHKIYNDSGCEIGFFSLSSFPGCPRVAISHRLEIHPGERGKGYGSKAQKERIILARSMGYEILLATVVTTNKPQETILRKNGWSQLKTFENFKTGNDVGLWMKDLNVNRTYEECYGS